MKLDINIYNNKLTYYYIYDLLVYSSKHRSFDKFQWINKLRIFER